MLRRTLSLTMLLCTMLIAGCAGMGGGVRVQAQVQEQCPPGTTGCTIKVSSGGIIRPFMGYMVDKQTTPSGQVFTNVAVNHSSASLVQTTLPAVVSAIGGWQAAAVQAAAIRFAAKNNNGSLQIYNNGNSVSGATAVNQTDVVQNPHDPDVNIDQIHLDPAPPGN